MDYTEALRMDPNNAFAFYNRGIALDRKGELQQARASVDLRLLFLPLFFHLFLLFFAVVV